MARTRARACANVTALAPERSFHLVVPLGLMFLVGLFKKRAPYSFGAWLARLGDDDVDIVRTYSAGDDGLSAPNSKDWTGHPAPDGGTYLDRHGTISSEAYH